MAAKRTKRSYARSDRMNQQLLEIISSAMISEVRDPRVQHVQITAVQVTQDMSHARVYYVLLQDERRKEAVQSALERLTGFMRGHVASELQIKHVPELVFKYDESIDRGRRMEGLLSEALSGTADQEEAGEEE